MEGKADHEIAKKNPDTVAEGRNDSVRHSFLTASVDDSHVNFTVIPNVVC